MSTEAREAVDERTVVPAEMTLPLIPVGSATSTYDGPRRYQIRFPESAAYVAAQAVEAPAAFRVGVANARRAVLGVEMPNLVAGPGTALRNEVMALEYFAREYGARIMEDYQYAMDLDAVFELESFLSPGSAQATLDDVVRMTRADQAWQVSTGENVVIAVVDTGIDGTHPEFPKAKRAGSWQEASQVPWTDWLGHGTMCAAIAAGTRAAGGRYDGIAPGAQLIACKTRFFDSQLAAVYDYLLDLVETKGSRIVATNSYGIPVGAAPPPPGAVFMEALDDAIRGGVAVVFSAGNYHELAGGHASDCGPTSIWQYKCRADILSVATCKLDRTMWSYSSRGPGDLAGGSGMSEKPDVTAPTPENGAVLYGDSIKVLANGWGTSGAAPQAAGLAALLLSHRPHASTSDVFDVIRGTAVPLGRPHECEGNGMIDCKAALDA